MKKGMGNGNFWNFLRCYGYWVLIALIVVLSFRLYAYRYFCALNSDHAIVVLMTADYELPRDFYFWGQDRYGSIAPLLAQPLVQCGMDALWAASLAQYFILLVGFLIACSFVKNVHFRIILALIWFLPPTRVMDHLGFYSGISYTFIFLGYYFWNKAVIHKTTSGFNGMLNMMLGGLSLIVACWTSDLAVISSGVLAIITVCRIFQNRMTYLKWNVILMYSAFVFIGVLGAVFISYAKDGSTVKHSYTQIADLKTTLKASGIFVQSIFELLVFRGKEFFTSTYLWLLIPILFWFGKNMRGYTWQILRNPLLLFLILEALFVLGAILTSEWSFQNNVPRRYFACTYLSVGVLFVLLLEYLMSQKGISKFHLTYLYATVLVAGLGAYYHLAAVWPGSLKPRAESVGEIASLGKVGIISNYWNAYVNMVGDKNEVLAIPYMWEENRRKDLIDQLFQRERLYVLRDMWMDDFADTLFVHKHSLVKDGIPFELGNCNFCRYRLLEEN